jgi:hypothetical protein
MVEVTQNARRADPSRSQSRQAQQTLERRLACDDLP